MEYKNKEEEEKVKGRIREEMEKHDNKKEVGKRE